MSAATDGKDAPLKRWRVSGPVPITVHAIDEAMARIVAALQLELEELPPGTVVTEVRLRVCTPVPCFGPTRGHEL